MLREGQLDFFAFNKCLEKGNFVGAKQLVCPENGNQIDPMTQRSVLSLYCIMNDAPDDPDIIHYFVHCGAPIRDVPCEEKAWLHPIHYAAINNKPKFARALLDHGAEVNMPSNEVGCTALFWAIRHQSWTCAKVLIDAGALYYDFQIVASCVNGAKPLDQFIVTREQTRSVAIVVLGLHSCGSGTVIGSHNGKDVLRMIARCVWGTRGHNDGIDNAKE